jgi:tetratricopeptide (TPR) repeat protein
MVRRRTLIGICVALALAVTTAYLPVLDAGFLDWDDDFIVYDNPHIRGLSWDNLAWAFTTFEDVSWVPLTGLSHVLDYELYGLAPRGHHATNLALHVANTVVLFLVLDRLTGVPWPSVVVAALFGLHPLHVESVAWVSERKDVLSTFFWLLAMAAYVRYVRRRTAGRYVVVAAAFLAGLLSKPMVVTLPIVLLLLDYWPLGRLSWAAVREKVPLVLVALACAAGAVVAQSATGGTRSLAVIGIGDRVANALVAYVRYLVATAWPARLSPWYSHPALEGAPLAWWTIAGAAFVLAAASVLAVRSAARRPHLAIGWLWYVVTLVPVIGLVQVGSQAMADRYTYVPLIGVFIALAWEGARLPAWRSPRARRAAAVLSAAALAVLGVLTWRQAGVWHDSMTFWTSTIRVNPRAAIGYLALGGMFAAERRPDDAIAAYLRALKLRPDYVNAHTEVGNLLAQRGRLAAAAAHYRKAIGRRREAAVDHSNLANVLLNQGRPAQARRHLEIALALRPDFAEAHNNLGIVLAGEGQLDDAIEQFRAALRAKPDFAAARGNLAATIAERRRVQGGEREGDAPPQGGP